MLKFSAIALLILIILSGAIESALANDYIFDETTDALTRKAWGKLSFENRIDEAQKDFINALEQDPADYWAAYGLARIYIIRGDFDRQLDACLDYLKQRSDHPLTELVLWTLDRLSGAVKGYGEKVGPVMTGFVSGMDQSDIEQRNLAYKILATIYYRRQDRENYDAAFAKLGYVREWNTLGPVGAFNNINFFEALEPELEKTLIDALEFEGKKAVKKRFFSKRGWINPPWFEDGLYYAESYIKSPADTVVTMLVKSPKSIKLFLNGDEIYVKDSITKYAPGTELVKVGLQKGWNQVRIKFIYGKDTPKVSLQIFADEKIRIKSEAKPHKYRREKASAVVVESRMINFLQKRLENNPDDPFAAGMLGITYAIYNHDELGKTLLYQSVAKNPNDAYFNYMLGSALRSDKSQPEKIAASKAKPYYQKALELAGVYPAALYRLSTYDRNENKHLEAIEKLKLAAQQSPGFYLWRKELFNIYSSKKWDRESRAELDAMVELLPDAPDVYRIAWNYFSRKKDTAMLERTTEILSQMDLVSDRRARLEKMKGNLEKARSEYEILLEKRPNNLNYAEALLDIFNTTGEFKRSIKLLKIMIDIAPKNEEERYREKLAQTYFLLGRDQAGRKELEAILDDNPVNQRVRNGLELYGVEDVLNDYEIDAFEQIEAGGHKRYSEFGAVMLIDQMVQEILPDLSNRQKIHQLIWVNSKAAIGEWAEVNLPRNVELLELRTINADGTISEPEMIESAKKSISMTDVGRGDFIEIKYITWQNRSTLYPAGYLGPKFYFRMLKYPSVLGQYVLIYPEETAMKWENANRVAGPTIQKLSDGRSSATWEIGNNDAYLPEPYTASGDHYMPYVQVGSNLLDETMSRWFTSINMMRTRPTYELRQAFDRITAGSNSDSEIASAIHRFVVKEIDGGGGALMTEDAGKTLASKRGSRTALMACLLDMAGIRYEIVAAKRFGQKDPAIFPHTYSAGAIRVFTDDEEVVYYDVSQKYLPSSFISPGIEGMEGKLLKSEKTFQLPRFDPDRNTTTCFAQIELDEEGHVKGTITRIFNGSMAAGLRRSLVKAEQYQIKNQIQRLLTAYFRAARMDEFDIEGLHDIEKPLVMRYTFEAANYARVRGDDLILDQGFYAVSAATSYARVEERESPMQLSLNINNKYTVELTLPAGHEVIEHPGQLDLKSEFGEYFGKFETDNGKVLYTKKFVLPLLLIFPEDYTAFKEFCTAIDQFEKKDLIIRFKNTTK
jgi:tetratricopeptide (TPR) repeat protein